MSAVPYHIRITILGDVLASGALGDVEIIHLCDGEADQPTQVLLRDRQRSRHFLIDLNLDGSIAVADGPYRPPPPVPVQQRIGPPQRVRRTLRRARS